MIEKAKATCSNGHAIEFGQCNRESRKLFLLKTVCDSRELEALSPDEIRCRRCAAVHMARACPECGDHVPTARFKQKSAPKGTAGQEKLV
jgi:hypothetical protein